MPARLRHTLMAGVATVVAATALLVPASPAFAFTVSCTIPYGSYSCETGGLPSAFDSRTFSYYLNLKVNPAPGGYTVTCALYDADTNIVPPGGWLGNSSQLSSRSKTVSNLDSGYYYMGCERSVSFVFGGGGSFSD